MALTPDQVAKISGNIKVWQSEIADLQEAIDNAKDTLAENLPHEKQQVGDYDINIFTGAKYDEAYGKKNNPELWEKFAGNKKVLPSVLAKAKMTEEEYALFQKPNSKTTVTVDLRED